jgi:hypothetical protein
MRRELGRLESIYGRHASLGHAFLSGAYLLWECVPRRASLTGMYLIYESSLRAEDKWRESLYRHQGCLKASDCGRLGR